MCFNYDRNRKNNRLENLQKLKYEYEKYDNDYFHSYHNKKYFKLLKRRYRTVWTEYGKLTYLRRIYKNKGNGDIFIPTDTYIGIEPYNKIINDIRSIIINNISNGKRNKDIKDIIPDVKISLQTISNILNKVKIKELNLIEKIKVQDNEKLYINIDDCYEWLISDNKVIEKYCIRIFSFNTGKKLISKNRHKLLNKRIAFMIFKAHEKIKQEKIYDFVFKTINNNYDIKINDFKNLYWKNPNLVIAGDGASWIRTLAKWLGGYYMLDKYHAFSYLWKSFIGKQSKSKENNKFFKYLDTLVNFKNGDYNQLINTLKNNNVNKQIYDYFRNNQQGIINQSASWNIGCSAESDVFHLVKSIKGSGAKIYNFKRFTNMITAKANSINSRI